MKLSSRRARLAVAAALALVIGVPASLAGTGIAAKVVGFSDSTPTADQYPASKVTICHHTHSKTNPFVTITVSQNALPAHLGHGDTVGPCSTEQPAAAPVAAATSHKLKKAHKAKHGAGKSSLHGQGKPEKAPKVKTHGKSGETHGQSSAPTTGSITVHGKSHSTTHGQGAAHQKTHGKGQANDKSQKTHGKSGQVHGNGQGHGNGNGQGQGGTHGNGGGNGKGH